MSRFAAPLLFALLWALPAAGQQSVLRPDALTTLPVGGLERTGGASAVVVAGGTPFALALRVTTTKGAADTNATQLCLPNAIPVRRGDLLVATLWVRGAAKAGGPARCEVLFERATDPWTRSISRALAARTDAAQWRRTSFAFSSAGEYGPGEAMLSIRLAFDPQTIELGGLELVNHGAGRRLDELTEETAAANPLGDVALRVETGRVRQTMLGFGGNFTNPRYGKTEPFDAVARYNLANLTVAQARIGLPLNYWTPERGVFRDEAQAHAALLQMQELARRKIPTFVSVWEGPGWMLGGKPEEAGRVLPRERWADCIEAVARFLLLAKEKYGAEAQAFSFNEPDYGVNFRFSGADLAAFIRQAGPRFRQLGLRTRFLISDTANGANFAAHAAPLLADRAIAPYLGPLAFHCWDALGAADGAYTAIRDMGARSGRPVYCTEGGHDSGLWQAPDPWGTWENALRTGVAYARTLRLSGAAAIDYWTYENDYPITTQDGTRPLPVFRIIRQFEEALPRGARVVDTVTSDDGIECVAAAGPAKGRLAVLMANPGGRGAVRLSGLPAGAMARVVKSNAAAQLISDRMARRTGSDGSLALALEPRSVTTVIVDPPPGG